VAYHLSQLSMLQATKVYEKARCSLCFTACWRTLLHCRTSQNRGTRHNILPAVKNTVVPDKHTQQRFSQASRPVPYSVIKPTLDGSRRRRCACNTTCVLCGAKQVLVLRSWIEQHGGFIHPDLSVGHSHQFNCRYGASNIVCRVYVQRHLERLWYLYCLPSTTEHLPVCYSTAEICIWLCISTRAANKPDFLQCVM
jgi:hypothetical protein